MENALLPKELEEKCIYEMAVGETGYTLPIALVVDFDFKLWIDTRYEYSDTLSTTNKKLLKVYRKSEVSFEVDASYCVGFRWKRNKATVHYNSSNEKAVIYFTNNRNI